MEEWYARHPGRTRSQFTEGEKDDEGRTARSSAATNQGIVAAIIAEERTACEPCRGDYAAVARRAAGTTADDLSVPPGAVQLGPPDYGLATQAAVRSRVGAVPCPIDRRNQAAPTP